jgi:hypothetical protein
MASGKTVEELEKLLIQETMKNRLMRDRLKQVSKFINQHIING